MQYKILITGACGMIGNKIVECLLSSGYEIYGIDRAPEKKPRRGYTHLQVDLGNKEMLTVALQKVKLTHIIHLAALAHTAGVEDLSWKHYFYTNVICAENVFSIAAERNIPILFSSTVDVYGIVDDVVDVNFERNPIGNYGKSKCLAEESLQRICKNTSYTIMRFAPVYTSEIKRDIQKRYYLKYPNVAYCVGRGMEYEVLNIENLISAVNNWVRCADGQRIFNVKDKQFLKTVDVIKKEKQEGRAKIVIWVPKWCVVVAFKVCRAFMPMAWKTFMLNKIVNPLRTR